MATIYQLPTPLTGTSGIQPNYKYAVVGDNLAAVTTAGYFNSVNLEGAVLTTTDIVNMLYSFNVNTQSGTFEQFSVSISNGVITLAPLSNAGEVTLPTIANHIATYTNTSGHLSEDPATAISGGNIQAGLSGTAGYLASFPSTGSKGSLRVTAVANSGDTVTTISNAAMGQASVVSIPDPANAVARFLVGATATPFVSGNFPVASGTGGLMVDSGVSAASLPTYTSPTIANHIAVFTNTTGNLGEDAATAINAGNIQAGTSAVKGQLIAYGGSLNGQLIINPVGNTGDTSITIQNAIYGQASVLTLPDPAGATANFALAPAALVNNNLIKASGTAGLVADAGIAASAVQLNTNIKAQQVTGLGGSGAGPLSVTAAGCTAASVVVVSIVASSNPVSVVAVAPGSGSFNLTLSGDPGATLTISYVMFIAAQ